MTQRPIFYWLLRLLSVIIGGMLVTGALVSSIISPELYYDAPDQAVPALSQRLLDVYPWLVMGVLILVPNRFGARSGWFYWPRMGAMLALGGFLIWFGALGIFHALTGQASPILALVGLLFLLGGAACPAALYIRWRQAHPSGNSQAS